ncbi:hypothetical protein ACVWY0_003175 [Arthrobacter sp. UYNi723]
MGIIRDFFASFRQTNCDGCGKPLTECARSCRAAAAVDAEWQASIK